MRQIKNVVFDFGGVIIDIDRDRAVKKFVEIGVKDADNLLDKYHQKGIFLEIEDGRIDAESFRLKLSEICGKELTYKEVEMGYSSILGVVIFEKTIAAIIAGVIVSFLVSFIVTFVLFNGKETK